jgi:hypothetical protein
MSAKTEIINSLKKKRALGNSNTRFKHLACDLLHATGEKPSKLSAGTFLSPTTIERVMQCDDAYRPQCETVERIFSYCNAGVELFYEVVKAKYQNKPKDPKE